MPKSVHNKFIGARSYEEIDKDIFFGREDEASELFQLVNINTFTLLYGKSGLGKTSVLQAGLFPKLRKGKYLPIYIRPNYRDPISNFIKDVERIVLNDLEKKEISHPDIAKKQTLWEYFHVLSVNRQHKSALFPVLIFDQFEEIFTLGTEDKSSELRQNTKQFIELLSDLIENSPPELLDEEKRLDLQYQYGSSAGPVKIIFSFREEYLGDFYSLANYIPSIAYSNLQYKLTPLSYRKGYDIIDKASGGLFEAEAIKETLKVISDSQSQKDAEKSDIDSFLLSIFCENQVENFQPEMGTQILAEHIKKVNIQTIIDEEYNQAIKEVELNASEIKLIEERLLSPEGYRWPVYLDIVLNFDNHGVREKKIRQMEDRKILKRYTIDGKRVIEIIHDKYALAVKSNRDFRVKAEKDQLQLLEDQEKLRQKKIEDNLRLSEEKSRLENEKIRNELKIAEEKYLLDKEKTHQERILNEQRIKQELTIAEERAVLASQELAANEEKLNLQKRNQRILAIAACFLLLLGVTAIFYYVQAKKQEHIALVQAELTNQKKDSLIAKQGKVNQLNKVLKKNALALLTSQKGLKLTNDSLTKNFRLLKVARYQALNSLNLAKSESRKADSARQVAEINASNLALEKAQTIKLLDSLNDLLHRNAVSNKTGQLFAAAKLLKLTEPAVSYQLAKLAQKLDVKNNAVSEFIDSLDKVEKYYEKVVVKGTYSKFAPDGKSFVTIDIAGNCTIYDLKGKAMEASLPVKRISAVQFNTDGTKLLLTGDNNAYLVDYLKSSSIESIDIKNLSFVTYLAQEKTFAIVSPWEIRLVNNYGLQKRIPVQNSANIYSVSAIDSKLYVSVDSGINVYSLPTLSLLNTMSSKISSSASYFMVPNTRSAIVLENKHTLCLWDSSKVVKVFSLPNLGKGDFRISANLFSQDGTKALISLTSIIQDRQLLQQQQQHQQQQLQKTTFAAKQPSYSEPRTFLININSKGSTLIPFRTYVASANDAVFSPDGSRILSASGVSTNIIDCSSQHVLGRLYHVNIPTMKELSPDNKFILTSFDDNSTKLWIYGKPGYLNASGDLEQLSEDELLRRASIGK